MSVDIYIYNIRSKNMAWKDQRKFVIVFSWGGGEGKQAGGRGHPSWGLGTKEILTYNVSFPYIKGI